MFTHAKYMKAELEQVYPIISDGSPSYFNLKILGNMRKVMFLIYRNFKKLY